MKRKITSWEKGNTVFELWSKGECLPRYYVKTYTARKNMLNVDYEDYGSRYNLLKAYPHLERFVR